MILRTLCFPDNVPHTHRLREIKRFLRNAFAHEVLDEAAAPTPARTEGEPGRRVAAVLFGREVLPEDPPEPPRPRRPSLLGLALGAEPLPLDPPAPPPPRRPGLLRALFAVEPLPELPPAPHRPRRSAWLRWLFGFERLDPP